MSIVETLLSDTTEYGLFVQILTKAGLINRLEIGSDSFTVFVPNNSALNSYFTANEADINTISGDKLFQDFAYHLVSGTLTSSDFAQNGYQTTESQEGPDNNLLSFYYSKISDNSILINESSTATLTSEVLSNGIFHKIDNVLNPPKLYDLISYDPQFSRIKSTFDLAGEQDDLQINGEATFMAPCNDAFDSFFALQSISQISDLAVDQLQKLSAYHVFQDTSIFYESITDGLLASSLENRNIVLKVDTLTSTPSILDYQSQSINFKQNNIFATNGILHSIDLVMNPGL